MDAASTGPEIRGAIEFDSIRIYINGLLHIDVQRSELFGVGTWRWRDGYFGIEFISQSGARIKTEYETEAVFKAVLAELQKLPLHGE